MAEAAPQSNLEPATQEGLAKLALDLAGNPKTRTNFLKLAKEVRPNTPIPEVDTAQMIDERFKSFEDNLAKRDAAERDQRLKDDLARQKADAKTAHGLDDAAFGKMEEMMKKGELPADYKWAAPLFKAQNEPAAPTNYGSSGFQGPLSLEANVKKLDGLMENEVEWSQRTAHSMIDDMLKGKRASAF